MKTLSVNVYQFDELGDAAKEKAREWYRQASAGDGYAFADDALASLKALAEHFNGKLKDYSIDFFACSHSTARFEMPEMEAPEIKARLDSLGTFNAETLRGDGECKLTGYCADEDAIDGLRQAYHDGERDLGALMQAAFDSWLKAAQADAEFQHSDEQVDDAICVNGYEFTADGERFRL